MTAAKFLGDYQPKYAQALKVHSKRAALWANVDSEELAPPESDGSLLDAWEKLIDFEMSNPEGVEGVELELRVRLVFQQALGPPCGFLKCGSSTRRTSRLSAMPRLRLVLKRACESVPESEILTLVRQIRGRVRRRGGGEQDLRGYACLP